MKKPTDRRPPLQHMIILLAFARATEKRLERINKDPRNQHCWDEWMTAAGYRRGLEIGLAFMREQRVWLKKRGKK